MSRKRVSILSGAALGGLVGLLLMWMSGGGVDKSSAHPVLAWALPLFAAGISGGVSWLVLSGDGTTTADTTAGTVLCEACGNPVKRDWRLCPYCGALVEEIDLASRVRDHDVVMPSVTDSEGIR